MPVCPVAALGRSQQALSLTSLSKPKLIGDSKSLAKELEDFRGVDSHSQSRKDDLASEYQIMLAFPPSTPELRRSVAAVLQRQFLALIFGAMDSGLGPETGHGSCRAHS